MMEKIAFIKIKNKSKGKSFEAKIISVSDLMKSECLWNIQEGNLVNS